MTTTKRLLIAAAVALFMVFLIAFAFSLPADPDRTCITTIIGKVPITRCTPKNP